MPLATTHDPAEFVASPIGRCLVGSGFATWCYAPDLHGTTLWGDVDDAALRDLIAIGRFVHHRSMGRRRRVLTDCRHVERPDADRLLGFVASARDHLAEWAGGIERQALVVPGGPAGVIISGAFAMAGLDHTVRVTNDIHAALAFLAHPQAAAAHTAATTAIAATRGTSVLLSRLRALLGHDLRRARIGAAASALGMSRRTLQRELQHLQTSFSEQLHQVRIARAEALLIHTNLKIEAIAAQVGYGTASRMSATMRRDLSLTASELRGAHRQEPSRSLGGPS